MRIAIASSGKDKNSKISPLAEQAKYYLLYEDRKFIESIRNPFVTKKGGAGILIAKILSGHSVELAAAGHYSLDMVNALKKKKIKKMELHDMTVKQALEKVLRM